MFGEFVLQVLLFCFNWKVICFNKGTYVNYTFVSGNFKLKI